MAMDEKTLREMQRAKDAMLRVIDEAPLEADDDGDFWAWTNRFWATSDWFGNQLGEFIRMKRETMGDANHE